MFPKINAVTTLNPNNACVIIYVCIFMSLHGTRFNYNLSFALNEVFSFWYVFSYTSNSFLLQGWILPLLIWAIHRLLFMKKQFLVVYVQLLNVLTVCICRTEQSIRYKIQYRLITYKGWDFIYTLFFFIAKNAPSKHRKW